MTNATTSRLDSNIQLFPSPVTPREALSLADLDWGIDAVPVWSGHPNVFGHPDITDVRRIPDQYELRRNDTGGRLGTVSDKYHPIENGTLADIIGESFGNEPSIVAAACWNGGRRVMLQAKTGAYDVAGVDANEFYATFLASHDGGGAVRFIPSTVRMECMNQVNGFIRAADAMGGVVRLSHVDIGDRSKVADLFAGAISNVDRANAATVERLEDYANRPVMADTVRDYIDRVAWEIATPQTRQLLSNTAETVAENLKNNAVQKAARRYAGVRDSMLELYASCDAGNMAPAVRGTRFHMMQAATEYLTHNANRSDASIVDGETAKQSRFAVELAGTI